MIKDEDDDDEKDSKCTEDLGTSVFSNSDRLDMRTIQT